MNAFKEMRDNSSKRNNNSIRAELFEYCRLDTYAMYVLINYYQSLMLKFSISSSSGSKLTVIRDSSL